MKKLSSKAIAIFVGIAVLSGIGFLYMLANNEQTVTQECPKCECPKCENVASLNKAISLYEQVLVLDGEGFNIAGEMVSLIMPAVEAGMYQDIGKIEQITATLKNNTTKIENLTAQKTNLLVEIYSLTK